MGSKLAVLVNIKEAAINRAGLGNFYKVGGISISSFTFHSNNINIHRAETEIKTEKLVISERLRWSVTKRSWRKYRWKETLDSY